MKAPSPLLGFNNNVRHKGRIFHIQTEDSGIRHPHIITHLFADGGRILKTRKTSYAEHVGTPNMAETVREMMKEQHKAMFIALREGHFDYLWDENAPKPDESKASDPGRAAVPGVPAATAPESPSAASAAAPEAPSVPAAAAASAPARSPSVPPPAPPVPPAVPRPATRAPSVPPPPPRPPSGSAPTLPRPTPPASPAPEPDRAAAPPAVEAVPPSRRTSSRPRIELDAAALHHLGTRATPPGAPAARVPTPPETRTATPPGPSPAGGSPEEPAIDLDLDILERAAAEAQTGFQQQIQDLPPPPASVIGRRPGSSAGAYSAITPPEPPPAPPSVPEPQRQGAGRYAPTRPASIFATTRPAEGASIFGEDLISEKSLDEVILSYLAEDLDPSEKK